MESILEELQLQVEEMKLTEENETPLYLAIAGLKQVERLCIKLSYYFSCKHLKYTINVYSLHHF